MVKWFFCQLTIVKWRILANNWGSPPCSYIRSATVQLANLATPQPPGSGAARKCPRRPSMVAVVALGSPHPQVGWKPSWLSFYLPNLLPNPVVEAQLAESNTPAIRRDSPISSLCSVQNRSRIRERLDGCRKCPSWIVIILGDPIVDSANATGDAVPRNSPQESYCLVPSVCGSGYPLPATAEWLRCSPKDVVGS